jgi:UPF0755 protein
MSEPVDNRYLRVASALAISALVTVSLHSIRSTTSSAPDFPCSENPQEVTIHIDAGDTGSQIGRALESAGIVKSSLAFFRVAVADSRSQRIAPGDHRVTIKNCARGVLEQLLDSSRIIGLINVKEGMWLSEIVPQLVDSGFLASDISQALVKLRKPTGFNQWEGLFFPAQYSFDKETSVDVAISTMIERSVAEMKIAGFFDQGRRYSPQKLLTIASLIQAEGKSQDFAKISTVIVNRLEKGMPLQFDSTVHYIKRIRGNIFLSTKSTLINSPYNTYQRYGLPPGPINNPGRDAMNAAVNPAKGNWLYFITVAPSDTRFTDNLSQFNLWKAEYKRNLRAGKFRSSS